MTKRTQRTRTDFLCLTIGAGQGVEDDGPQRNYRYNVQVQSDATGAKVTFRFHDSVARYAEGVDQLDRWNLLWAFRCFAEDAQIGSMSFAEYCGEFGANIDSISERRTWEACRSAARKFARLFHDDREPSFVVEQLAAEGVE